MASSKNCEPSSEPACLETRRGMGSASRTRVFAAWSIIYFRGVRPAANAGRRAAFGVVPARQRCAPCAPETKRSPAQVEPATGTSAVRHQGFPGGCRQAARPAIATRRQGCGAAAWSGKLSARQGALAMQDLSSQISRSFRSKASELTRGCPGVSPPEACSYAEEATRAFARRWGHMGKGGGTGVQLFPGYVVSAA